MLCEYTTLFAPSFRIHFFSYLNILFHLPPLKSSQVKKRAIACPGWKWCGSTGFRQPPKAATAAKGAAKYSTKDPSTASSCGPKATAAGTAAASTSTGSSNPTRDFQAVFAPEIFQFAHHRHFLKILPVFFRQCRIDHNLKRFFTVPQRADHFHCTVQKFVFGHFRAVIEFRVAVDGQFQGKRFGACRSGFWVWA